MKPYKLNVNLKKRYIEACTNYVRDFCIKHNIHTGDWNWVGTRYGKDVCLQEKMWISMDDVMLDIDKEVEVGVIEEWYEKSVKYYAEQPSITFNEYVLGKRYKEVC